ncbi:hypothetical protein QYF36_022289 [Acer negundo]|nr:hypothetical protein QYF36_022289 [Acer negundo]
MAQSGVVIGKPSGNCQTSSSSSDDSSFSDDSSSNDDFGKENQLIRSGPIFVRDGSGGPVRMRRGMDLLKDLEAKFVKVIEESITRGVNLRVANPAYGEDVGWNLSKSLSYAVWLGTPKEGWDPYPFHFFHSWADNKEVMDLTMKELRNQKVLVSKGIGLAVKLKAIKGVFKKWQSKVKSEYSSLDILVLSLEAIEANAKVDGLNEALINDRVKDTVACLFESISDWMEQWVFLCPSRNRGRVWKVAFHAFCWSIWERRRATKWCPPFGLKFNVDGFLRGNQGPTSIGGILRNHDGDTICMFSSFLGDGLSSSVAEMSAILKVCEMCEFDNCPDMLSITIESYCKCVVRWVNGVRVVDNVRNLDNILEIREFLHRNAPRVLVKFVPRSSKVVADILAKLGALSGLDQVVWRS